MDKWYIYVVWEDYRKGKLLSESDWAVKEPTCSCTIDMAIFFGEVPVDVRTAIRQTMKPDNKNVLYVKLPTDEPPVIGVDLAKNMFYEKVAIDRMLEVAADVWSKDWPTMLELADAQPVTIPGGKFPWWRKDKLGWPIETIEGRPIRNFIRIICLNIRKLLP
jgi:hypothetical protein